MKKKNGDIQSSATDTNQLTDTASKETQVKQTAKKRRLNKKAPSLLALEARLMFDGAVAVTVDQTPTEPESPVKQSTVNETEMETASYAAPKNDTESQETDATSAATLTDSSDGDSEPEVIERAGKEGRLVLISGYLPEVDQIARELSAEATVHILKADGNIVAEISDILAKHQDVQELHIVSHGEPGALVFGTEVLDEQALHDQSEQVASWGSQLTADADILLYGCDMAAEQSGVAFLKTLHGLTGADIAASDDSTGAESLGGDAQLEVQFGEIASSTVLTSELLNQLDLILDNTPPHVDSVDLNITDTTLLVTLNMSEPINEDVALTSSTLYLNIAGIDQFANFVPVNATNASDPAASDPANARLVYQLNNVSQVDLAKGLRMGQVVFDASGVIVDGADNALVPASLTGFVDTVHVDAGETLSLEGGFNGIDGSNDFVKTGAGELILTGANSHPGKTIVEAGTLRISADDQLGDTTSGTDRVVVKSGATLLIEETLTLNQNRGIVLESGATIAVADGKTVTYNGKITGDSGPAIKSGGGELKLTNPDNFSEGVTVEEGRLTVTHGSGLDNTATLEVSAGAVLDITNNSQTIGELSG